MGVECSGLRHGIAELGVAACAQWTPPSCPSLVLVAEVRDCASCPIGRRLAPPRHALFTAKPSKESSRTERARVALACVWMQLLKLRKTATSQGCKYDVLRGGMKHSTTCGKAAFMAARVASLAWMLAMSQRRIHACPSLLGRVQNVVESGWELQDRGRRCSAVLRFWPGMLGQDGVCLSGVYDLHQHVQSATAPA